MGPPAGASQVYRQPGGPLRRYRAITVKDPMATPTGPIPESWRDQRAWEPKPATGPSWPPPHVDPTASWSEVVTLPGPASPLGSETEADTPIPSRAAWWCVLGFVFAEMLGSLGLGAGAALFGSARAAGSVLLAEVGIWSGLFATCLFVSGRYGTGRLGRDLGLRFRPVDGLWGLAAVGLGLVYSEGVQTLLARTRFQGSNDQVLRQQHGTVGFAVVAVVVAVGAPFFEELFFRGLLRRALQARLGAHGGIWAQAALFALAHVQPTLGWGNVSVVAAILGLGVVLGYTARLSGRLAGGMIAHALFNIAAVLSAA
jgi:membrane protease YdiL (CAAX protease family)